MTAVLLEEGVEHDTLGEPLIDHDNVDGAECDHRDDQDRSRLSPPMEPANDLFQLQFCP